MKKWKGLKDRDKNWGRKVKKQAATRCSSFIVDVSQQACTHASAMSWLPAPALNLLLFPYYPLFHFRPPSFSSCLPLHVWSMSSSVILSFESRCRLQMMILFAPGDAKHTLIWKCCSVIVSVWASRPTNPWWWFSIKVGSVGEAGQKALEKKHLWFPNGISSIIRQTSECNQRRRSCYVWFSTSQQHNPTLISKLRRCPKTTTTRATVKAIYMFIALDGWQEAAKKKKTF